jgi:hypothetical protein
MLEIRGEQVEAFAAAMTARADAGLAGYARRRFPPEFAGRPDADVLAFVRRVRAAARGHGVEREDDVSAFLDFTVMYGPDFPAAPWAADVFAAAALSGSDRMAELRRRVRATGVELYRD